MKTLNVFLLVLAVLLLIVIGGALLAFNFGAIELDKLATEYGLGFWPVLVGGAMLLFGLIAVLAQVTATRPERSFSIQNPDGEIRITFNAIEDMLRKATSHIEGIEDIRPRVVDSKKGLEIISRVAVLEEVSIPQVTMRIQEVIKSQVSDVLGLEEVGAIRTHIYRISPGSRKKDRSKSRELPL